MSIKNPFNIDYQELKKYTKYKKILFIVMGILSIMNIFFDKDCINTVLIIVYIILCVGDCVYNCWFEKCEKKRREDFFDNSFNTKLVIDISEQYFTNDDHKYGIKKLGVNLFENAFFSKEISSLMFKKKRMFMFFLSILLLISLVYGFVNFKICLPIIQILISRAILLEYIEIYLYAKNIEKIFEGIKKSFSEKKGRELEKDIIKWVVDYEAILFSSKILLDDKIFNENNPKLSEKWIEIKKKYKL